MKKMLQLVKQKVENNNIDMTLKFTLSALWNLTGTVKPQRGYSHFSSYVGSGPTSIVNQKKISGISSTPILGGIFLGC